MNKVMLIGNVGVEPEIRYVEQGVAVARLRLATTERGYTLANGTQVPDVTEWHSIVLWRNLAEWSQQNLRKSMKVYVEGKLKTRSWEKDGQIRRKLAEVVEKYVHKGDKLYIEGRLRYSSYDDKQGQRRYVTEVWADNMELLSPKPTE